MTHQVRRYHDISTGHRVVGHENKCRHLHGHNYRVHFVCESVQDSIRALPPGVWSTGLDHIGRVIDFGVVKEKLCMWLENNWDHKFLAWEKDQLICNAVVALGEQDLVQRDEFVESLVFTPFNPTAENMAQYLVEVIGPQQLEGTGVRLVSVNIEETAKCSASFSL